MFKHDALGWPNGVQTPQRTPASTISFCHIQIFHIQIIWTLSLMPTPVFRRF